ncbi:MAG: hypothetical protein J3Q66DRAFT_350678 [Benniella sp.]|nr:MAG: hypothetical protein J3Q66DRAFT_350678 [Benniella sp.]
MHNGVYAAMSLVRVHVVTVTVSSWKIVVSSQNEDEQYWMKKLIYWLSVNGYAAYPPWLPCLSLVCCRLVALPIPPPCPELPSRCLGDRLVRNIREKRDDILHCQLCSASTGCKEKSEKECNLEPSSSREFTPCSYRQQYRTHPPLMVNQE